MKCRRRPDRAVLGSRNLFWDIVFEHYEEFLSVRKRSAGGDPTDRPPARTALKGRLTVWLA
jgi:hypothetical protein